MQINYARHHITKEDIKAVEKALKSDRLAQGPLAKEFEEAIAKHAGTLYAVSCSNGTTALQMMYQAVGVGPDTTVYCPAISYVATANAAKMLGAKVIFYGSEIMEIEDTLSAPAPKLVVRMHYGGKQSNLHTNLPMVDDSCHSMTHDPSALASAFSFHPTKFITTGEGGMVVTNDEDIYKKCLAIRDNGRQRIEGYTYPTTTMLGSNFRLSEIGAALGLSQLKRLPEIMEKRKHIAELYNELLKPLSEPEVIEIPRDITPPDELYMSGIPGKVTLPDTTDNQLHLYAILCDNRDRLQQYLADGGVEAQINYVPIYRHPYWAKLGYNPIPSAEEWSERCLSLPIHPGVSDNDVKYICKLIKDFYVSIP